MFHSSNYEPTIAPVHNGKTRGEIDRVQDMNISTSLNRTRVKELGNADTVCWKDGIPSTNLTFRQYEYGAIETFQKLACTAATKIKWDDFKTTKVDVAVYLTDDTDTFKGTVWAKNLRLTGFGVNIGDPDALIERNFTLVGEDYSIFQNSNKYIVYLQATAVSTSLTFTIGTGAYAAYEVPVMDPDHSGQYFLRCIRYRASDGSNTEMVEDTDFTYNSGTGQVSIATCVSGDVFTFVYSTGTYISGTNPFTVNTSDLCSIKADECTILLASGTTISKLQSVSFDVAFDRQDVKEIGDPDVVATGSRDITTTVNLGTILETWSLDEVLRDKVGETYGILDVREYTDNITLIIKVYEDNTKTTFKMGYKITGLTPTSVTDADAVDDYTTRAAVLESHDESTCFVSTTEGDFA